MHSAQCEGSIAEQKTITETAETAMPIGLLERLLLWQLNIVEVTGHTLEARGREEVNRLLDSG
jgi:hypothetical protein